MSVVKVRPSRVGVIAMNELHQLRQELWLPVMLVVLPAVMMAFFTPVFRVFARQTGASGTGAELAVPGMSVTFVFFVALMATYAVFNEHTSNTWIRLRATDLSALEILIGKAVVPIGTGVASLVALFLFGVLVFDLRVVSWIGVVSVSLTLCFALATFGLLFAAFTRSIAAAGALINVVLLLNANFGGALTPLGALPSWARAVGHATVSYWAMRGYRFAIRGGDTAGVASSCLALLLFGVAFTVLVAARFRMAEAKTGRVGS